MQDLDVDMVLEHYSNLAAAQQKTLEQHHNRSHESCH